MSATSDKLTLGLMAKYWDAGRVKTRLGDTIGMQKSAALHRLFVMVLCKSLSAAADRRIVCMAPDQRLESLEDALRSWGLEAHWEKMPQGDGDLGHRMSRWFEQCLGPAPVHRMPTAEQTDNAILIGADCPTLDPDDIREANQMLQANDVVLGPAADGGYYLIGLRGSWQSHGDRFASLFRNIPWSTDRVLSVTRERLKTAGLRFAELQTRRDVDTHSDLDDLQRTIASRQNRCLQLKAGIEQILNPTTPTTPGGR